MSRVERCTTSQAPRAALDEVRALLGSAFPGGFSEDDWEHSLGGDHIIVRDGGVIVSHAAVVARRLQAGDRTLRAGYVEGVGTLPHRQGEGWGSLVMRAVTILLTEQWQMGALSTGRCGFYARLGWEMWLGPSFVIHGEERVRSAAEDGGIMVLRYGPSADVDLAWPIACEARAGDDW